MDIILRPPQGTEVNREQYRYLSVDLEIRVCKATGSKKLSFILHFHLNYILYKVSILIYIFSLLQNCFTLGT